MSKFYSKWKFRYVCSQWEREKNGKGQSYYMAEATGLLRMLPICESGHCALLAIDEIILPALKEVQKIGEK